jgi:transcriptional regulator with XRE-family HTH domain
MRHIRWRITGLIGAKQHRQRCIQYLIIHYHITLMLYNTFMKTPLHETIRARRLTLGLSQAETARRSGIQQRQVSLFQRGSDVTLATLAKLAQALDFELLLVPREAAGKVEYLLATERGRAQTDSRSAASPSLLERYQVKDEEEPSRG